MFKILSIDGGGIRGVIPAFWLGEMERRIGRPLHECFDLVVGTSTGSILAAGIAAGIEVERLLDLYVADGDKIFPPRGYSRKLSLLEMLTSPKYSEEPLADVLQRNFSDRGSLLKLRDLQTKCVVISYDVRKRSPAIFRSWHPDHEDLEVWGVCKGSCSAPTYFPAHVLTVAGVECPLVDGGIVANNPASLAVATAIQLKQQDDLSAFEAAQDLFLVSLGTGNLTESITIENARTWGSIQWAFPMLDVLFDAASAADDFVCEAILKRSAYVRMQVDLKAASEELDEASASNISDLKADASRYLDSSDGAAHMERIIHELSQDRNAGESEA